MRMSPLKIALASAAMLAASATSAHANPVTFDFGAGPNTSPTATLNEGGFQLDVSGFNDFNATIFVGSGGTDLGTPGNINRNNAGNGWGVNGDPAGGLLGRGEVLNLDFGGDMVRLLETTIFELDGDPDSFVIFNDTDILFMGSIPADPGADTAIFDLTILPYNARAGSNFTIATASGGIRLQSLTVDKVPAPATLPLLATGLGLLAAARRNRKAAA